MLRKDAQFYALENVRGRASRRRRCCSLRDGSQLLMLGA